MLNDGLSNDGLTAGTNKDAFVFTTKRGTSKTDRTVNFDKVTNYSVKDDSVYLDNAIFKKLGRAGRRVRSTDERPCPEVQRPLRHLEFSRVGALPPPPTDSQLMSRAAALTSCSSSISSPTS
jgi:hypothetical protein